MTKHEEVLRGILGQLWLSGYQGGNSYQKDKNVTYYIQQIRDAGFVHVSEVVLDERKIEKIRKMIDDMRETDEIMGEILCLLPELVKETHNDK